MFLTYCPPDTIKVALPGDLRVHGRSYVCELCSPGMKSEGGDYIVCTADCDGVLCPAGGARFTTMLSAGQLQPYNATSGEAVQLRASYRHAVRAKKTYFVSQEVVLDTTPPHGGSITDRWPCDQIVTTTECTEEGVIDLMESDADTIFTPPTAAVCNSSCTDATRWT